MHAVYQTYMLASNTSLSQRKVDFILTETSRRNTMSAKLMNQKVQK